MPSSSRSLGQRYAADKARAALRRKLEALAGRPIRLRLNHNRHTYFSVQFPKGEPARLSLSRRFAEAPDDVLAAVARMMKRRDPEASEICRRFVDRYDEAHPRPAPALPRNLRKTKGQWHDLAELAREVNAQYFNAALNIRIAWGKQAAPKRRGKVRRRRSVQFGSYDRSLDVVRINPVLDSPDVPRFYMNYLVYHELLHKALGERRPSDRSGKARSGKARSGAAGRRIHHAEFQRRESLHEFYRESAAWEKSFFDAIASGKPARRPRGNKAKPAFGAKLAPSATPAVGGKEAKGNRAGANPTDREAKKPVNRLFTQLSFLDDMEE